MSLLFAFVCAVMSSPIDPAHAEASVRAPIRTDTPSGLPVPRFVSLKANETYGRVGPSFRHPIHWELHRRGLPVEVIAETEHWRKVRDHQGDEMWIHYSRLDGRRHALLAGCESEGCAIRAQPRDEARTEAVAQNGVIARLLICESDWCQVRAEGYKGWLKRADIWGVYRNEIVQ